MKEFIVLPSGIISDTTLLIKMHGKVLVNSGFFKEHGQAFSTYTNLIYKAAIGKSAKQLRKDNGLPQHGNVVALLTSQELIEVTRREAQVCTLLDCGMRYEGIKAVLLRKEEAA